MTDYGNWRRFFLAAGAFNICGALAFSIMPSMGMELMTGYRTEEPAVLFIYLLFWFFAAVFGVGYCLVGLYPTQNHGIVIIGGAAKLLLFPMAVYAWANDFGTLLWVVLIFGDVIWAMFFGLFLRSTLLEASVERREPQA